MKNVSFKRSAYDQNRHISGYYTSILSENNLDGRIYFAKDGIYLGNGGSIGNADLIGLSQDKLNTILQDVNGVVITKANLGTASTAVTLATTDASTKIATTEFVAASIAESAAARQALVLAGFAHPALGDDNFRFSNINTVLFPHTATDIQNNCDEFYKLPDYDNVRTGYLFKVSGTGVIKLKNGNGTEDVPVETGDTIYITRDYTHVEGEGESGYITKANVVILLNNVNVFGGATASAAGTKGLVPAPTIGDVNNFLRGDGSWAEAGQVDGATINGIDLTVTDKKIIIPLAKTDGTTSTIGYGVISDTFAYNLSNLYDDWDNSDMNIGELNGAVADIDDRLDAATTKIVDLEDSISELNSNKVDKETNKSLMSNEEHAKLGGIPEDAASIGEFVINPSASDQTISVYLEYTDKDGTHEPEAVIPAVTNTYPGVMTSALKIKLDSVCTWEDE